MMICQDVRRFELTKLYRENINGDRIFFVGKGNKAVTIRVPKNVAKAIQEKLSESRCRHLFCSTNKAKCNEGKPMSLDNIDRRLKAVAKRAGIEGLSPHKLRYSFATELYDSGADIRTVRYKLRHSSIRTTELYIQADNKVIEEEYDRCFEDFDRKVYNKYRANGN